MASYNKVTIMGHVGGNPESRVTKSGAQILKFSLATNRSYSVGPNEWREETDWHKIVVFGALAERQRERVNTGDLVIVEGRLHRSTWKSEAGEPRSKVEVVGQWMRVLGRLARRVGPMEPLFDEDAAVAGGDPFVPDRSVGQHGAPVTDGFPPIPSEASVDADIPF